MADWIDPDLDELATDALPLYEQKGRPLTVGEWAEWYGLPRPRMASVLATAVKAGKLGVVGEITFKGHRLGPVFGPRSVDEYQSNLLAGDVLKWMRENMDALYHVECSCQDVADGLDEWENASSGLVHYAMTKLLKRGDIELLRPAAGRRKALYRVTYAMRANTCAA